MLHRVILWVAELELDTQVPCGIDSSPAGRATGRIVMHAWFLLFSSAMDVLLTRPAITGILLSLEVCSRLYRLINKLQNLAILPSHVQYLILSFVSI